MVMENIAGRAADLRIDQKFDLKGKAVSEALYGVR
jgi:hypothetical protein